MPRCKFTCAYRSVFKDSLQIADNFQSNLVSVFLSVIHGIILPTAEFALQTALVVIIGGCGSHYRGKQAAMYRSNCKYFAIIDNNCCRSRGRCLLCCHSNHAWVMFIGLSISRWWFILSLLNELEQDSRPQSQHTRSAPNGTE